MSEAVFEECFVKLVEDNGGFEFYQAYRNDVDHILGGKGNTFWYVVMKKGKVTESYIGKNAGGVWEDVYVKGSGATQKTKAMPAGSTIRKIAEKAYLCQDETPLIRIGNATNHEFTERELDVLKELTTGDTNAEIAERLFISVETVKSHILHLMEKTGFKTRTELVSEARGLGIVIKDTKPE